MSEAFLQENILMVAGAFGWFGAGALLGLLHFVSLRHNVRRLMAGQLWLSFGLQLSRLALTGASLVLTVRFFGAWPLLVGTLGFMVARTGLLLQEPQS